MSDAERRREREYVEGQIRCGRSLAELHRVIDDAAQRVIEELRGADVKERAVRARRDVLLSAAVAAADHLRSIGAYGGADEALTALEDAMERARD